MKYKEQIESFVQGTKQSFQNIVDDGTIDIHSIGRQALFLVENNGDIGVTTPVKLPYDDMLLGKIVLEGFINEIKYEHGCRIICICEVVYEDGKLGMGFVSLVEGNNFQEEYIIKIDLEPHSVTDELIQMGVCLN
jgi:hypothetical protein